MDRVIKFRGLRTDGKGWVYGHLFMTTHNTAFEKCLKPCIQEIKPNGLYYDTFQVIPSSVGQFTGLTDKNGKEIYEGDLVIDIYGDIHGFIQWRYAEWVIIPFDKNIHWKEIGNDDDWEVIGNIHEETEVQNG